MLFMVINIELISDSDIAKVFRYSFHL